MLMKLTHGLNFINILHSTFTHVDPKCAKKTVKSALSFYAFWARERKSCTFNVDENDTWWHFDERKSF